MLNLLDPEPEGPPRGLVATSCDECGAPAAVDDRFAGDTRCIACWAKLLGVDVLRPIVLPRHLRSRFTAGDKPGRPVHDRASVPISTQHGRSTAHPSEVTPTGYRVLIAAREATPGQIPHGAAVLLAAAASAGRQARATYALAEERASGRMVHSCAVRVADLGYALWIDGAFSSAHVAYGLAHAVAGAEHFKALVEDRPYVPPPPATPPPVGPCPRCPAIVRWRIDKQAGAVTYKHQRAAAGEGGRNVKVPCE